MLVVGYACYAGLPKDHNQPKDSTRSIIGISVTQKPPLRNIEKISDTVFFLKVNESDNGEEVKLIPSNYRKGDRIYLINAEPGKYKAIAAYYASYNFGFGSQKNSSDNSEHHLTIFSGETVEKSETEVKPGEFAFMGKFVIENSMNINKGDKVQKENYLWLWKMTMMEESRKKRKIREFNRKDSEKFFRESPGAIKDEGMVKFMSSPFVDENDISHLIEISQIYRGGLNKWDKSAKSIEKFLTKAKKKEFKKTGWLDILNKQ
jgi:hypothetical protein